MRLHDKDCKMIVVGGMLVEEFGEQCPYSCNCWCHDEFEEEKDG